MLENLTQEEISELYDYGFLRIDDVARIAGVDFANELPKPKFAVELVELKALAEKYDMPVFVREEKPDLCKLQPVATGGFEIEAHEERGFAIVGDWLLSRTCQPYMISTPVKGKFNISADSYIAAIPKMDEEEFTNKFNLPPAVGRVFLGLGATIELYLGFLESAGVGLEDQIVVFTHAYGRDNCLHKLPLPKLADPDKTPFVWN